MDFSREVLDSQRQYPESLLHAGMQVLLFQ